MLRRLVVLSLASAGASTDAGSPLDGASEFSQADDATCTGANRQCPLLKKENGFIKDFCLSIQQSGWEKDEVEHFIRNMNSNTCMNCDVDELDPTCSELLPDWQKLVTKRLKFGEGRTAEEKCLRDWYVGVLRSSTRKRELREACNSRDAFNAKNDHWSCPEWMSHHDPATLRCKAYAALCLAKDGDDLFKVECKTKA